TQMADKADWQRLSHQERLRILAKNSDEQIIDRYRFPGDSAEEVQKFLAQERALWLPDKVRDFRPAGKPPTKHALLGSYRDLERSEALLELIDNSIDVWRARRATYPRATAKELNIFITIDEELGLLRYEDNAGGVPRDKVEQLVVPGY